MTAHLNLLQGTDRDKLDRTRRTVLVVLPHTARKPGEPPRLVLLTDRDDVSVRYAENFDARGGMSGAEFFRAARPMRRQWSDTDDFGFVRTVDLPPGGEPADGATGVGFDQSDPTYTEAAAGTKQPHYDLPAGAAPPPNQSAGEQAFAGIQSGLRAVSIYRRNAGRVARFVGRLLAAVGGQKGLPAVANGGPMPAGLPAAFEKFALRDDPRAAFDFSGVDLTGGWARLTDDDKAREALATVMAAGRDVLLGEPTQQFNNYKFRNLRLPDIVRNALRDDRDLPAVVRAGRNGWRTVTDTLCSRPHLGRVLQWVLKATYAEVETKTGEFADEYDADERVMREVLSERGDVLPPAVKRATPDQRRAFGKELNAGFAGVLDAAVAAEAELPAALAKLTPALRELVDAIRKDGPRHKLIVELSGVAKGPEMKAAFVEAVKCVTADVLLPTLYREPVLGVQDVKRQLRSAVMSLYLTALLLSDKNEAAVKKVAEKTVGDFEEVIDSLGTPGAADKVVATLVDDLLKVLGSKSTAAELKEGVRLLTEAGAVYEAAGEQSNLPLFEAVYAARPGQADSVTRTAKSQKKFKKQMELVVAGAFRQARERRAANGTAAEAKAKTPAGKASVKPTTKPTPSAGAAVAEPAPATSANMQRVYDLIDQEFPDDLPDEAAVPKAAEKVAAKLLGDPVFFGGAEKDLRAFDGVAGLVYERFADPKNANKKQFRRGVLRMTLLDLMLQQQTDLAFGSRTSALYMMVSDLVETVDEETRDPSAFVKAKPLTTYFENGQLADGGVTALRVGLDVMAAESKGHLTAYLSDLHGLEYLLDHLSGHADAEVIVFDGTAKEFADWIKDDSLTANGGRGRMRLGGLRTAGGASDATIVPGAIYFADSAFPDGDKAGFLESWKGRSLRSRGNGFAVVLPPVVLSTGPQGTDFEADAAAWVAAADGGPLGVTVVGPSPDLNPPGSSFPTYLPAGYLTLAHFVGEPEQRIVAENVDRCSAGRFRAIGYGSAGMKASQRQVLWGDPPAGGGQPTAPADSSDDAEADTPAAAPVGGHALEADFYAYLILQLVGNEVYNGAAEQLPLADLYQPFYCRPNDNASRLNFGNTAALGDAVHGGDPLRLCLAEKVSEAGVPVVSVTVCPPPLSNLLDGGAERAVAVPVGWVNRARKAAGLP